MRRRQLVAGMLAVLCMVPAVAGCGGGLPQRARPRADTIRLGMLAPLTGRNASSGNAMVKAAKLAVREANSYGGVLGRQVELVTIDDACDQGSAVSGANELVARGIAVSVGGFCSSATVPTMKIFQTAGIPMIIPLSNSTDLVESGYNGVFLISGTVDAEGAFAVDRISALGKRRLALVHDGTSFPQSLAEATAEAATAGRQLNVVAKVTLLQGAPSYAPTVKAVLAAGADAVYFTGYFTDARQLIIDLRAGGFAGTIVLGDGAAFPPVLAGLTGRQVQELYGTSLLVPEFMPELAEWVARYQSAYGEQPPADTIEAYDAVTLALDAIRRAGTMQFAKLVAAIRASEQTPSLLSGPVSFTDDGARANPRFLLIKARGNRFELMAEPTVG